MLTENDKQLLLNLKKDNPEAYDLFMRRCYDGLFQTE